MSNQNQPNELDNQPKVSNESSVRLPEATKGKIRELLDNPEIAHKRRVKHQEAMKMNTFNLRHGAFSKYHPTPQYLQSYLSYIDDLTFEDRKDVREGLMKLVKTNLKRVALAEHFELVNGNIDPQLSKLMRDTFVQLSYLYQTPSLLTKPEPEPIDLKGLKSEQLNALDDFVMGLTTLLYSKDEPLLAS